jgi:hypothetical protein
MATAVNWLFIVLGVAIGIPVGVGYEKGRIWLHRTKAGLRLAGPLLKVVGTAAVVLIVAGFVVFGVVL